MTHANPGLPERVRFRLYGLAFLVVVALLLALCYAAYNKTFTPVVTVKYQADRAGLQLLPNSDVKVRGLIVGEVRDIRLLPAGGAELELAIQKDKAPLIPANVTGRLLPKTLFGEKYVELSVPAQPAGAIRTGSVIKQDTTAASVEVDKVLNDLLPVLQAVKPEKLNATLNALATALDGRGDQFGRNLEQLDSLLTKVNPKLKTLMYDLKATADVADIYDQAAPDLLRTLRNLNVTNNTIVQKRSAIEELIPAVTGVADKGTRFMNDNGNKIVGVNVANRTVLDLLATYSPAFPCTINGMVRLQRENNIAHGSGTRPSANLMIEIVKPRPAFKQIDKPEANDYRKPRCFGLPNPRVPFPNVTALDGTEDNIWWKKRGLTSAFIQPGSDMSDEEFLKGVVAPVLRVNVNDVPDVAQLLFGPLAHGSVVNLK